VTNRHRLAKHPQAETPAAAARRPLRILVADGHAAAADSLALLLTVLGHEVEVARTGPAALDAFHARRPDLLLSDIVLPKLDGLDLVSRLGGQRPRLATVLVALTGLSDPAIRRRVRRAGYHHHLVKPVAPDALQVLLDSILPSPPAEAPTRLAVAG